MSMNRDPGQTLMFNLATMGKTPGWQEIKDTAHADQPAHPARLSRFSKFLGGPGKPENVSAEHLKTALSELGEQETNLAKMAICNTVGFAHHVLQAEALAHSRSSQSYFDQSDRMATGAHWIVKQRGFAEETPRDAAQQKVELLASNRQKLPFAEHSSVALNKQTTPFFYGYSELYGMARANFTPERFGDWLFESDIIKLPDPTEIFLRNNERMMARLVAGASGPVAQLEEASVYVPEAMQIADSPTLGVLFSAALRVINHTQA